MKNIIVYSSKHGSTKAYAEWLAQSLEIECFSIEKVRSSQLQEADGVILGSAIYMGHLRIADWLLENWHHIKGKKLALYSVSATDPEDAKVKSMIQESLPREYIEGMKFFHLPGKIEIKNLFWWEKLVLNFLAYFEKNSEKKKLFQEGKDMMYKTRIDQLRSWLETTI